MRPAAWPRSPRASAPCGSTPRSACSWASTRSTALTQGVFDVLIVIAAIELLGLGESGAGWLNAAWGVGGVLGGVAALALLGRGRLASGLTVGMAVAGLTLVVVGAWPEAAAAIPL